MREVSGVASVPGGRSMLIVGVVDGGGEREGLTFWGLDVVGSGGVDVWGRCGEDAIPEWGAAGEWQCWEREGG